MINLEFLKDGDLIGVTAPSCGILKKVNKYEKGLKHFENHGFRIVETNNVRTVGIVSSSKNDRWTELKMLIENPEVKMISCASGGDFLYEVLDLVDYDLIKNNPKWFAGSSDPTNLLFTITTILDTPTIYTPCNMSGFDMNKLHESLENYFKIIKGEKVIQKKYDYYESEEKDIDGYNLDSKNEWININGDTNCEGIIIGGCIESIKNIIGTKFDHVTEYIEKHKDTGIIWYFDVFSMSSTDLSLTLRQFNNAGWFKYTKAILIGKVKYVPKYNIISYEEGIERAELDIPIVYKFDIGHVKPSFTIINGSLVKVVSNNENRYVKNM